MKIFNKFVESKTEPYNKQDIWFDGSVVKLYKNGSWESVTLPLNIIGQIQDVLTNFERFKLVDELPEVGEENIIYMIFTDTSTKNNTLSEYLYVNNNWEEIGGSIPLDLLNFTNNLVVFSPTRQSVITAEDFKNVIDKYDLSNKIGISLPCLFKTSKNGAFNFGLLVTSKKDNYIRIDILQNKNLTSLELSDNATLYNPYNGYTNIAWLYDSKYNILTPLGSFGLSADKILGNKNVEFKNLSDDAVSTILSKVEIPEIEIPKSFNYIENITYKELKNLKDNSQLVPGQQYRIIDYVTIATERYYISAKHQFDLIVRALTENVLDPEAKAARHEGDTYFKDEDLSKWKIWYDLDDQGKLPFYSTNIKMNFGDHEIISKATYTEYMNVSDYECTKPYALSAIADNWVILEYNSASNKFFNVILNGQPADMADFKFTIINDENTIPIPGTIYRMIDENNNDLPYDFKNLCHVGNIGNINIRFQMFDANRNFNTAEYFRINNKLGCFSYTFFNTKQDDASERVFNFKAEKGSRVNLKQGSAYITENVYVGTNSQFINNGDKSNITSYQYYKNIHIGNDSCLNSATFNKAMIGYIILDSTIVTLSETDFCGDYPIIFGKDISGEVIGGPISLFNNV